MAIPTLAGFSTGEKVLATKLTEHTKGAVEASVYFKPVCRICAAATQNIASGTTPVQATLATIVENADTMADTANNRIVIKTAGLFRVSVFAGFASNATGHRHVEARKGATAVVGNSVQAANGVPTRVTATDFVRFAVNDLLTLWVSQSSGIALNTDTSVAGVSVSAEWIRL